MTCPRCHNSNNNFINACTYCGCTNLVYDDLGYEDDEIDTEPVVQSTTNALDEKHASDEKIKDKTN